MSLSSRFASQKCNQWQICGLLRPICLLYFACLQCIGRWAHFNVKLHFFTSNPFGELASQQQWENLWCVILSICDGGDEPSWQYMAMGSYDKTVCPDSLRSEQFPQLLRSIPFIIDNHYRLIGKPIHKRLTLYIFKAMANLEYFLTWSNLFWT